MTLKETLGQGNAHTVYTILEGQTYLGCLCRGFGRGGRGIFTDTYTKHKCGVLPKRSVCLRNIIPASRIYAIR